MENEREKLKQQKEESDKRLLKIEYFVCGFGFLFLLTLVLITSFITMAEWIKIVIISLGLAITLLSAFVALQ